MTRPQSCPSLRSRAAQHAAHASVSGAVHRMSGGLRLLVSALGTLCVLLAVLVSPAAGHDVGEVSKKGFLFHDDDAPFSLPMDIYVALIGMNNNGARHVTVDAPAVAQSLFNSLPTGRPSCLQNGKPLHAQYLLNYHVFHTRTDIIESVERLIAEHMVRALDSEGNPVSAPIFIASSAPEGFADAMYLDDEEDEAEAAAAKGHAAKPAAPPGQHLTVPVFDIEIADIEAALDGLIIRALELEMQAIDIDTSTHRPFHESGVVVLNPEKDRMRAYMRERERAHLANPLDGGRPTKPYVYRYRYNGGVPTKQWVGYGRHVFMDLSAAGGTYGASSSGEGTVSRETIPPLETALDHKVASSLYSQEEIVELFDAAGPNATKTLVKPSTRFLSRLVSVTINAVRKVFVADVRFSKLEYAERIIVPIIVLRNHEQFNSFSTDTPLPSEDGKFADMKIDVNTLRFELNQMLLPSQELVVTTMTHSIHDHRHISSSVFNALMEDTVHTPAAVGPNGSTAGYVAKTVHYLDSEVLISQLVATSASDALLTAMVTEHRESRTRAEAEARAYRAAHQPHERPVGSDADTDADAAAGDDEDRNSHQADADAASIDKVLTEARKGSRNSASSSASHLRAGKALGNAKDKRKAWEREADKTIKRWRQQAHAGTVLGSGPKVTRQRIIPVFVYSLLGLPEGVLLDRTHVATPSARGSLVVALQTLASEIPLPFFSDDGMIEATPRNPTRGIVASVVSALGGIVPPYLEYLPEKKKLQFDYTWAVGQHAFGPFATTTSMSQAFQDAVLRNSVLTRLSGSVKLVKAAVHELARFHRHFIADPLSVELQHQRNTDIALFGADNIAATDVEVLSTGPDAPDAARDASFGPDAWFASLKRYRAYASDQTAAMMATGALSPFAESVLLALVGDLEKLDARLLAMLPLLADYKWDVASLESDVLVSRALEFKNKVSEEVAAARYELSCCRKVYSVYGDDPTLGALSTISGGAAAAGAAAAAGGLERLKSAAAATASRSAETAALLSASVKSTGSASLLLYGVGAVSVLLLLFVIRLCWSRRGAKQRRDASTAARPSGHTSAVSGAGATPGSAMGAMTMGAAGGYSSSGRNSSSSSGGFPSAPEAAAYGPSGDYGGLSGFGGSGPDGAGASDMGAYGGGYGSQSSGGYGSSSSSGLDADVSSGLHGSFPAAPASPVRGRASAASSFSYGSSSGAGASAGGVSELSYASSGDARETNAFMRGHAGSYAAAAAAVPGPSEPTYGGGFSGSFPAVPPPAVGAAAAASPAFSYGSVTTRMSSASTVSRPSPVAAGLGSFAAGPQTLASAPVPAPAVPAAVPAPPLSTLHAQYSPSALWGGAPAAAAAATPAAPASDPAPGHSQGAYSGGFGQPLSAPAPAPAPVPAAAAGYASSSSPAQALAGFARPLPAMPAFPSAAPFGASAATGATPPTPGQSMLARPLPAMPAFPSAPGFPGAPAASAASAVYAAAPGGAFGSGGFPPSLGSPSRALPAMPSFAPLPAMPTFPSAQSGVPRSPPQALGFPPAAGAPAGYGAKKD